MCLSKGITGGHLPLSCVLATDDVYGAFYDDDVAARLPALAFVHGQSARVRGRAGRARHLPRRRRDRAQPRPRRRAGRAASRPVAGARARAQLPPVRHDLRVGGGDGAGRLRALVLQRGAGGRRPAAPDRTNRVRDAALHRDRRRDDDARRAGHGDRSWTAHEPGALAALAWSLLLACSARARRAARRRRARVPRSGHPARRRRRHRARVGTAAGAVRARRRTGR